MSHFTLRTALLALLGAPLLTAPASGKPVELKDLTQAQIRARVKAYLAAPANAANLAPFKGQVALREDQIIYTAVNGVPQRLEWRYRALPGHDRARESELQARLRDVLRDVLVKFDGGLVSERDAQTLLARARFVPVMAAPPTAGGPPPGGPRPPGMPLGPPRAAGAPPHHAPAALWAWSSPYRFVVYPWVATAPHCTYWWQYPWYAAPWWGYPWWTYWYVPNMNVWPGGYWYASGYYATPAGYWYLPPQYNYWAYWNAALYGPAYHPTQPLLQSTPSRRVVKPIPADRSAESLYFEALGYYWDGAYADALELLTTSAERDAGDARVWYYKALTEQRLGDESAARESARRGAALALLHGAERPQLAAALERVQGDERQFLRNSGTGLTVAQAKEISSAPVKRSTAESRAASR